MEPQFGRICCKQIQDFHTSKTATESWYSAQFQGFKRVTNYLTNPSNIESVGIHMNQSRPVLPPLSATSPWIEADQSACKAPCWEAMGSQLWWATKTFNLPSRELTYPLPASTLWVDDFPVPQVGYVIVPWRVFLDLLFRGDFFFIFCSPYFCMFFCRHSRSPWTVTIFLWMYIVCLFCVFCP